jgi:hypothetical protein
VQPLIAVAVVSGCAAARHADTTPPGREANTVETMVEAVARDPGRELAAAIQDPSTQLHLHIRGVVELQQGSAERMAIAASRALPYIARWRRLMADTSRGDLECMTADSHAFACVQTPQLKGDGPILVLGVCRDGKNAWRLASVLVTPAVDDMTPFLGAVYTTDCPEPPQLLR